MRKFLTVLFSICLGLGISGAIHASDSIDCWFPPAWKAKGAKAKAITEALSERSGVHVAPRIARSYPDILTAFSGNDATLVYVGSFVQSIIKARGLGVPLTQTIDGKEMYGSWMVYPNGGDPDTILSSSPEKVAFTQGASSGESGAKAATGGKASIATPNHGASVNAVRAGKAEAAFVKNWWWEANKSKFTGLETHQVPGVSDLGNPDNVLTASKATPAALQAKIKEAALASHDVFGGDAVAEFEDSKLEFSLKLMAQGQIDPLTYSWQ